MPPPGPKTWSRSRRTVQASGTIWTLIVARTTRAVGALSSEQFGAPSSSQRPAKESSLAEMFVDAIRDNRSGPDHPLGDAVDVFVRRENAARFIEEVRGDDPELASYVQIEERHRGGQAGLSH
jgi:hypothetical protein